VVTIKTLKKAFAILIVSFISVTMTGCWNYRGADKMETVKGVAIDMGPKNGTYLLTFEIINLSDAAGREGEVMPELVESVGTTIYDAIRKANNKLSSKLYFSQMQTLIINQTLAKEQGISPLIEWFLHDNEARELINVVISGEKTAKELFNMKPISVDFVGQEICEIIDKDRYVLSYIKSNFIYEVYNCLNRDGIALTLPIFMIVQNGEKPTIQADGSAVFKKDKMIGNIPAEIVHFSLFVTDEIDKGILTTDLNNDVALEIMKTKTKSSISFDGKKIKIKINVQSSVMALEIPPGTDMLDVTSVKKISASAQNRLVQKMHESIKYVQTEYQKDVFGFGKMIYEKNHKLWHKLSKDWDVYFKNAEVEIKSNIFIRSSGMSK